MVAIDPVLEDNKRKLKTDDVRLPTAFEVQTLTASFLGPDMEISRDVEEETRTATSDGHQVSILGESANNLRNRSGSLLPSRYALGLPSTTDRSLSNELAVGPVEKIKSPTVQQENESLDEKQSLHDAHGISLNEPSAPPCEPPRDNNEPRATAMDQAAPNSSITNRLSTLLHSTLPFRHAISKKERETAIRSSSVPVQNSFDQKWQSINASGKKSRSLSVSGITSLLYRSWCCLGRHIFWIELRRRWGWHRDPCRRRRPSVGLIWILSQPEFPANESASIVDEVLKNIKVFWFYLTLPFILAVNILCNILYFMLCFPVIFCLSYHRRSGLPDPNIVDIESYYEAHRPTTVGTSELPTPGLPGSVS